MRKRNVSWNSAAISEAINERLPSRLAPLRRPPINRSLHHRSHAARVVGSESGRGVGNNSPINNGADLLRTDSAANQMYQQQEYSMELTPEQLRQLQEAQKRMPRNGVWGNKGGKSADQGLWLTSAEQFDELFKSIDDLEKFLRS